MGDHKYRWLVAGNVIAAGPKGQPAQRGLNTMVSTDAAIFTRADMARAQDGLMRRFVSETPKSQVGKILDVFLLSVTNLGFMTEKEFNAGMLDAQAAEKPAGTQVN